jgi:hypothetical protein
LCQTTHYEQEPFTRSEDYSKWYNELVVKADLAKIQELEAVWLSNLMAMLFGKKCKLDRMFKAGHQNAYFHYLFQTCLKQKRKCRGICERRYRNTTG